MPLQRSEVVVGIIAYLDAVKIVADARIAITGPIVDLPDGTRGANPVTRNGPFVCIEAANGNSLWVYLTNQYRKERLHIRGEWVLNGYGPLGSGQNYLQDGANTYAGPVEAFVDAAAGEAPFQGGVRPTVTADGVAAIRSEVKNNFPERRATSDPRLNKALQGTRLLRAAECGRWAAMVEG